ncbi:5-formyltetrahydrofolate cyclo-ligase [Sulfitobacter aestuarii]|uniref:5-formyltetrahydrofolate cyclo-ligase n=1 Tax=Sulfitobacter aestuarii TaxID=2161676 RepID=A0ABW5U4T7_9RHOB
MNDFDESNPGGDAPCFAHELVDGQPVDPQQWRDVNRFRKAERIRLLARRREVPQARLKEMAQQVGAGLDKLISPQEGMVIAGYWPIRGELDLRFWLKTAHEAGAELALPVVVQRNAPVEFHRWAPGAKMNRGIWNIPVPAVAEPLIPDIVLSPLLGVDAQGYRLGNGGGYYDRTLAAADPLPRVIGVGHDFCPIKTIFPMHWDIPMHQVVLGDGSVRDHRP